MHRITFITALAILSACLHACRAADRTAEITPPEGDWGAQWIGTMGENDNLRLNHVPARYLQKEFFLPGKPRKATLYICGLGLYEAAVNGHHVTAREGVEEALRPTVSGYRHRVYYNAYDVTSSLSKGENAMGITLGGGRYTSARYGWMLHFGLPELLLRLDVTMPDGSICSIVSDTTWRATDKGPIVANNEYDGEIFDSGRILPGFSKAGCNTDGWEQASLQPAPEGRLELQPNPNIAVQERLRPRSIRRIAPGRCIVDMGQNVVGRLRVRTLLHAGDTLVMRFSETLEEGDTSLYVKNLRGAKQRDVYIASRTGRIDWHPLFTYHGFRFVEISLSGKDGASRLRLRRGSLEGQVLHDSMRQTGRFKTSDERINTIYHNAVWGIRGNYRGMPTDCPQRDERLGWLGDRVQGCRGEAFIFDNRSLYRKWVTDIADTQTPEGYISNTAPVLWPNNPANYNVTWPSAFISVSDMLRRQYGDFSAVREYYPKMLFFLQGVREHFTDSSGLVWKDTYGDWCMPPESLELIHSNDPSRITDGGLLSSAFYFAICRKMASFAAELGLPEDEAGLLAEADKIRDAFNAAWFHPETASYSNGTLTANILPLYFGIVPDGKEDEVFETIVAKITESGEPGICCGVVGMMFLMRTLSDFGRPDLALSLALRDTYPSWGYMAGRGATTIWELWNGDTAAPDMNSGNHVMLLGDLVEWFYSYLGGISPAAPGFREITLRPFIPSEGPVWVDCSYDSPFGLIRSHWRRSGTKVVWRFTVPEGTSAMVFKPGSDQGTEYAPGSYRLVFRLPETGQ